ncbi:saccharopine dehydrogenase NADP-binding domain-containing protein [Frateuria hangzhouensis]|uniref:saccharopine dehydrogenase NADP-binding domain-containing protein n=1 Tax=Frateuria hangzhouensis TaxID=2995589 RepID=UPI002260F78F|nr:saccharopine dehydrogenase NADP-binding domain-containing protein [Frateuria sp. STR12]MCX7513059.1 saccharopine dehydrogenase NADP-binding domain-containing protein [Frateuria sp. STR12]
MGDKPAVAVFGAYGHTARFVVDELCRRGYRPILCGRDEGKLAAMAQACSSLPRRQASVGDAASLDRALSGAVAVINCASPFLDTGAPVIEAALRAGIHYLDLTAEQRAVQDVFERHAQDAARAGVVVLPAMAFYGGLADLLATAAAGDWLEVDAIEVAVALDSWHLTMGTRLTSQRNHYPRLVVSEGELALLPGAPLAREWSFGPPFGDQAMVAMTLSEVVTIARHLKTRELISYINRGSLEDIRDPTTPPPLASDASGCSAQRFAMDVRVRRGGERRRAQASGQDIYAVSAPLVVEALERILQGAVRGTGALPAGAAFDARDFLTALASHLAVRID